MAALMLTLPEAFNVSVVGVRGGTRVQVIAPFTLILPAPVPVLVVLMAMSVPVAPVRAALRSLEFMLDVFAPAVGV